MRAIIFGDSIAHGHWDTRGGWVQRLRTLYDKQTLENLGELKIYPEIYNMSIAGDTAQGVVRRLNLELKTRHIVDGSVVIIAIGINDTMIYQGVNANSPELFEGELQQIIAATRQFTGKILFIGMNAVDETVCDPWRYSGKEVCFKNDRILEFEGILRDFCKTNELPHVQVFEQFQGKRIDANILSDGLHPNDAGHQLIAELVKPELDKLFD